MLGGLRGPLGSGGCWGVLGPPGRGGREFGCWKGVSGPPGGAVGLGVPGAAPFGPRHVGSRKRGGGPARPLGPPRPASIAGGRSPEPGGGAGQPPGGAGVRPAAVGGVGRVDGGGTGRDSAPHGGPGPGAGVGGGGGSPGLAGLPGPQPGLRQAPSCGGGGCFLLQFID